MRIRGNWSTKFTLFAVINFIHNFLQFTQYCFLNLLNSWSDTPTSQKCYTLRSPSKLPILIVIRGISLSQAVFVIARLPAVFVFLLAKVWRTWAVVEFWNKSLYVFYLQRSHAHVDFAVANMLPSRNNFDLLDDQLTKQYKVSKLENRTSSPISRPRFFFLVYLFWHPRVHTFHLFTSTSSWKFNQPKRSSFNPKFIHFNFQLSSVQEGLTNFNVQDGHLYLRTLFFSFFG